VNEAGRFLRQSLTIAVKDLRSEWRTKEALNASTAFSLVILVLFSFIFDSASPDFREMTGGLLWMVYAFAGVLLLNRSFARETVNDCLDGLLAAPLSAAALFTGKALANFILLMAIELISLPVFALFYGVHWVAVFQPLLFVMVLGTWGLTVIGTAFSALTLNLRLRELMLPTMIFPLMIPALMSAMTLTTDLLSGVPIGKDNMIWIRVLVAFDFIFTIVAASVIDSVLLE
jgi:heme exporter protein B